MKQQKEQFESQNIIGTVNTYQRTIHFGRGYDNPVNRNKTNYLLI